MTETAEPFDNGPRMYESGWSALWAGAIDSGVIADPDALPSASAGFGGTGAISFGTSLQVFGDSTGRQVKVQPGLAHIQGHLYKSDAIKIIPLPTNSLGHNRIDYIVARLDVANKTAYTDVLVGTSATVPPTLTQIVGGVWEIPLATVTVANGYTTVASGDVAEKRAYCLPINYPRQHFLRLGFTCNGSGVAGGAHGVANLHKRVGLVTAFCVGNSGEAAAMNIDYIDGSNVQYSGGVAGHFSWISMIYIDALAF